MKDYKMGWKHPLSKELLAGLVVCMALMPEVIGFSIVAGVDPMIGIYASFCISIVTAFFGGRPGMISAAAGAMALVLTSLVKEHGIQYMFAATILTGVFQLILGFLKVGKLMKYIPKPVMLGFVNALGIMMFTAQIEHFKGSFMLLVLGALGIAVIYLFPKITRKIPSPIIAITLITTIVIVGKLDVTTLGDMGNITTELPKFILPNIPFNMETLMIILPYSCSLALVGLVESLLTAQLLDDMTDSSSNKSMECVGQGIGNIVAGFFGGIAGCGMIGQSITNHTYGGRGRLSTLMAGTFMMLFVMIFNPLVVKIPTVALACVMVVVSITTFNFDSIKRITKVPKADTITMLVTVTIVLLTHNLAYGVLAGIMVSALFFVAKISTLHVERMQQESVHYHVKGQLFFASTESFINSFDYNEKVQHIIINLESTRLWDESAVAALDKVIIKYHKKGIKVNLEGVSQSCSQLIERMATHNKPGGLEIVGH